MDKSVNNLWKNCGKHETTLFYQKLSTRYSWTNFDNSSLKGELSTYPQLLLL